MSGYDAWFVYDETPDEPQHTLKIAIFGAETSRGYSFERARQGIRSRVEVLAPMRWRAHRVPLDLHHPVWIDQGRIDLDHHVRRLAIPAPGGQRELCEVISEVASLPLEPDRPLWEIWLLEGYRGEQLVAVMKMSHALADGAASREMFEHIFTGEPVADDLLLELRDTGVPEAREQLPSRLELVRDALRDALRDLLIGLPRLVRAAIANRRRRRLAGPVARMPSPLEAQPHPFGGPLRRRRSFAFATLALLRAREVKATFGVTLNDVLLATVAGGLRRYLEERGQLPEQPVLAVMPASIRSEAEQGRYGNRMTTRFLRLPTHVADPEERLHAAHQTAAEAKRDIGLKTGAQPEDWIAILPPFAVKLMSLLARVATRTIPAAGGLVVSNVPGPRSPLYAGREPVENLVSVGHMKFVAGLNITIWSYVDKLNFAIYGCRETVPEPWRIAGHLEDAFQELVDAAAARRADAA